MAVVEESKVGAGVEGEGALVGALWDQTESGGGTGADSGHGTVYGGTTGIAAGFGTAEGDVRAGNVDGQFWWKTGLGAAIGGVGEEAGKWRGWAAGAGGAER